MKQLILDLAPDADPTLDNFVAGPNAEALQALRDLAASVRREAVVYLFGAPGSGRTHLLRAVVASFSRWRSVYVTADAGYALADPLPDLVAWDDVHTLDDAGQARLFGLQIRMRESGGVLLCAGDVSPARLAAARGRGHAARRGGGVSARTCSRTRTRPRRWRATPTSAVSGSVAT